MFAVVFIRGKPYGAQNIVSELLGGADQCIAIWLAPLTSLAWNIVVPIGLLVLSISSFKAGDYREVSLRNIQRYLLFDFYNNLFPDFQ